LAMMVAAASACDAVFASTVTASAMPSEKLRPWRPEVATPRMGSSASTVMVCIRPCRSGRSIEPTANRSPAVRCSAMSPPVVDVGAIEPRGTQHRGENFFRNAAGDRRHRRYEMLGGKRRHRRMHAARDDAR